MKEFDNTSVKSMTAFAAGAIKEINKKRNVTPANMTVYEKFEIVFKALRAIGLVQKGDTVSVEKSHSTISRVRLNGVDIGRFDYSRKAFVD